MSSFLITVKGKRYVLVTKHSVGHTVTSTAQQVREREIYECFVLAKNSNTGKSSRQKPRRQLSSMSFHAALVVYTPWRRWGIRRKGQPQTPVAPCGAGEVSPERALGR